MQTFDYKGYFVMLEKQHNGSIRAVADNDYDRFGVVFYDYSMTEIKRRIKTQCTHRLGGGIMKTCNTWNGTIEAYTPTELESLKTHGKIAGNIWHEQWQYQGAQDLGTCTGGKGLQVWYVGKGKRKPELLTITRCDWVQGNVSAQRSKDNALMYLESKGINATYYDGWVD